MFKITISGNTFPIKCFLIDQNFYWNSLSKQWEKIVDDENFPVYIPKEYKSKITLKRNFNEGI